MIRLKQGDAEFRNFVAKFSPTLARAAYLLLHDRDAAEDATQVTLLRTFRRWSRARVAPEAYTRRVLINVCRNHWRHQRRHPIHAITDDHVASGQPGIVESDQTDQRMILEDALAELPPSSAKCWSCASFSTSPLPKPRACSRSLKGPSNRRPTVVWARCASFSVTNPRRYPVLTDQQLGDTLSHALHNQTGMLSPRPGLADRVIHRRRITRLRSQLAGATAAVAALAIATAALTNALAPRSQVGPSQLRLASYTFKLPEGAHAVSATPAACAIGAYVVYTPGRGEGASSAGQPAIAQAVTSNGGCVAMLLTNPYTPGAANAPREPFPVVDQHTVEIGSYTGTVGTYEILGGPGLTIHGAAIPNGTQHVTLTLHLSATGSQAQDLQVAVAGISEQQLVSIVASGLTAPAASTSTSPSTSTTGN